MPRPDAAKRKQPLRTNWVNDERERTEERDGIIVPPDVFRIPGKTSVGGHGERDDEQGNRDI